MGRISKKKGFDVLIPSLSILKQKYPKFKVLIVGPDNEGYKIEVESLILKNNLTENVVFLGMKDGQDKVDLYENSDAFVLTSHSENFGMSVIESMVCGCPILISDQVGISDIIEKYDAGVVTSLKPELIADSLYNLITNFKLRETRINNAFMLMHEEFDSINISKKLANEIQALKNDE